MQVKNVNIGDMVSKSGVYTEPGVVTAKKPDGTIEVDTEPLVVNKFHRYANTTGLSEEEKNLFNGLLDEIYQKTDDVDRIQDIQTEVDKLRLNPENQQLVRYLRNQQAYLIRQAKGTPRVYQTDESAVKA